MEVKKKNSPRCSSLLQKSISKTALLELIGRAAQSKKKAEMSFDAVKWAIGQDSDDPKVKLLLIILPDFLK